MSFYPRDTLARWVREDGHPGCADLIETVPVRMLPSTLKWVARHIERHPNYDDAAARWLPNALRQNAEWRAARKTPLDGIVMAVAFLALFALAYYLEAVVLQ
jgi:hypothetical protein